MSREYLSEEEHAHLYACLLVGNGELQSVKKKLTKLNREDPWVDGQVELNVALRRRFNPRAEEEAREAERRRTDPAQTTIDDEMRSSGETGGRTRKKKDKVAGSIAPAPEGVAVDIIADGDAPPTDQVLRDNLIFADRMVLLSDIRGWTSSDRDAVLEYTRDFDPMSDVLVEPDCLRACAMSQERVDYFVHLGPWKTRLDGDDDDTASTILFLPPINDDDQELIEGEYPDGTEAEILCARKNREIVLESYMEDALVTPWFAVGPWTIVGHGPVDAISRWSVVHLGEDEVEPVQDEATARGRAARYNRQLACRNEDGSWPAPPIHHVTDDSVQDIKSAIESGTAPDAPIAIATASGDDDDDGGWVTHKDDSDDLWETEDGPTEEQQQD